MSGSKERGPHICDCGQLKSAPLPNPTLLRAIPLFCSATYNPTPTLLVYTHDLQVVLPRSTHDNGFIAAMGCEGGSKGSHNLLSQ